MVSVLVNIFGSANVELAEDVVQDALYSALESWKFRGIPDNPKAWLYRTARNKAIDIIRKNRFSENFDFSKGDKQLFKSEYSLKANMEAYWQDDKIKDQFLGMMYACCHPELSQENQVTFILKSLCGFSTKEVSRAFLTSEDTISKRLLRTKNFFRQGKIRPEIPEAEELASRNDAVLSAIYLIFNEGHHSTHNADLIRKDLIGQALYLCRSLIENEKTKTSKAMALMALICFHAARVDSRIGDRGRNILLPDQDRSLWSRELIEHGKYYLNQSASGSISSFHLEAAIAYEHCRASTFQETDWKAILAYYDVMLKDSFDSVVFLNRCLAEMEYRGPEKALASLEKLANEGSMKKYYLFYAARAEMYKRCGRSQDAVSDYSTAISLNLSSAEKEFLTTQLDALIRQN